MVDLSEKVAASLGKGIAFPFRFGGRGKVVLSEGTDRVKEALFHLLMTGFSERTMLRSFGTNLKSYLFTRNDFQSLRIDIITEIRNVINRWEKRVILDRVEVVPNESKPGEVTVSLDYTVIRTGETDSLVYPMYLAGG